MDPLSATLASLLVSKVVDEIAYRYRGPKYPKIREYAGFFGFILKLVIGRR